MPVSRTTPGAVPAMPSETRPPGSVACLRTPSAKSAYGRRIRSANRARDLLDLGLEVAVDLERAPCDPGDELDRPVVVRRPEATGDEAHVGLEALAECRLEPLGVVADDCDVCGLEPEQQRLTGVERPVQVCPLSAHELAARDDDGGARTPQERGEIVRCPLFGTLRRTPATRTTTFPGDATASAAASLRESFRLSALEGAAVERLCPHRSRPAPP